MMRSELLKSRQTVGMGGVGALDLKSPCLLAAVVVALAGVYLPIQAQASEAIAGSEPELTDEVISHHPSPIAQPSTPTTEESLEDELVAESEPLIDGSTVEVSAEPSDRATAQPLAPTVATSEAAPADELATPVDVSILDQIEAQAPATTVNEWLAQIEASRVQIIDVRVEETDAGLQIVLETAEGELATPATQTVGNALIADIPNAVLALPDSDSFTAFGPAEGIALVSVTNEPGNQVRISITGTNAPPVAEVSTVDGSVVLSMVLGVAQIRETDAADEAIRLSVTAATRVEDSPPSSCLAL
ncbi:MAG: AMIN domain-containing protein, partial [Leptolyngbya sp. SIO4C5]|nr:AMIN domain-containing protein [Leptolyngbya sp. SIO4C5]